MKKSNTRLVFYAYQSSELSETLKGKNIEVKNDKENDRYALKKGYDV
jgi:hypothetical protein